MKSVSQHCIGALHRVRSTWLDSRTARLNMVRGLLRELGIFVPVGARHVVPAVLELVEDPDSELPECLRESLHEACLEIREFDKRIRQVERQLEAIAQQTPVVRRRRTIPGIGLLTSTALVASVGDVQRFRSSRRFANYFGLTPREYSSGNIRRLGRISKQGRQLLTNASHSWRPLCSLAFEEDGSIRSTSCLGPQGAIPTGLQ